MAKLPIRIEGLKLNKKTPLWVLVLVLVLVLATQAGWLEPVPERIIDTKPGYYRVVKIEDGDTVTVDMNGSQERVRFIGVDTPETQDPRKPIQCFGHAATNFTRDLIGNNDVRLEADPLSANRDRYNRLLRYVYLPDGRLVQAEIIKQGYGFAYLSFPFTKSEEFRVFGVQAREQSLGLWEQCDPKINQYGGYDSNPE